jgi:hypothetical protein
MGHLPPSVCPIPTEHAPSPPHHQIPRLRRLAQHRRCVAFDSPPTRGLVDAPTPRSDVRTGMKEGRIREVGRVSSGRAPCAADGGCIRRLWRVRRRRGPARAIRPKRIGHSEPPGARLWTRAHSHDPGLPVRQRLTELRNQAEGMRAPQWPHSGCHVHAGVGVSEDDRPYAFRHGRCVAKTAALAGRAARTAPGFAPASPRLAPPSTHHPSLITHHPSRPYCLHHRALLGDPARRMDWSLRAVRYRWTELLPTS